MLLSWERLVAYYGPKELGLHRWRFEQAYRTTHGMLCCRWAPGEDRIRASRSAVRARLGEHSEARLIETELWKEQIPAALHAWTPRDQPIVTAMVLNRTPCAACSIRLAKALEGLHGEHPGKCDINRFLLVCRGKYVGKGPGVMTLIPHLRMLREAGWELGVLQMGPDLPPSGQDLVQDLYHHRLAFPAPIAL